ncbi:hypothetical protein FA15DRAFT_662187 [Coprinopsis marcescibilis]|nr:hypothetical protein FA15DRAFT_662187 [Coprinopsis marcescibilis]
MQLEEWTAKLGALAREFLSQTCSSIETWELKRETQKQARSRTKRASRKQKNCPEGPTYKDSTGKAANEMYMSTIWSDIGLTDPRRKTLNLNTYKFHALGDVVQTIKLFGTTDSYSTQMSELFHKQIKARYQHTNRKLVEIQMAKMQLCEARMRQIENRILSASQGPSLSMDKQQFYLKLKCHILPQILQVLISEIKTRHSAGSTKRLKALRELHNKYSDDMELDVPSSILDRLFIADDRIYKHNRMHINYTTYDLCREQDVITPNTDCNNIMCLRQIDSDEGPMQVEDRFVYGRVLGIYHVNTIYGGPGSLNLLPRRLDFLWVRWYDRVGDSGSAIKLELECLRFASISDPTAFVFLDPNSALRASHIIPQFSEGRVYQPPQQLPMPRNMAAVKGKGKGKANQTTAATTKPHSQPLPQPLSKCAGDKHDWKEYYINRSVTHFHSSIACEFVNLNIIRFVDRDMFMRYSWGLGVGHIYSHPDAPSNAANSVSSESNSQIAQGCINPKSLETDSDVMPKLSHSRPQSEDEIPQGAAIDSDSDASTNQEYTLLDLDDSSDSLVADLEN